MTEKPGNQTIHLVIWRLILAALTLVGSAGLAVWLFPFNFLKPIFDRLALDGTLDAFTPELHALLAPWLGIGGVFFLLLAVSWLGFRAYTLNLVGRFFLRFQSYSLRRDFKGLLSPLESTPTHKGYLPILLLITLIGAGLRSLYANQPMRYDEAYTVVAFAARPLWNAISDYHLPNNHVFHTLLVHFSVAVFGNQAWAARLPVLLAGVFCIPAAFLAGRMLFNHQAALLAASWIAVVPVMVDYSTNARGYTLICLFSLLLMGLGAHLLKHKSLLGWLVFGTLSALGFYTLPIMLYPFGAIILWLFLSWLAKETSQAYSSSFLLYLAVSGMVTTSLTTLFYLPILLVSGSSALFGNRYIAPRSWREFTGDLPIKASNAWSFWIDNWPSLLVAFFITGLALSLVFHRRIAKQKVPFLICFVIWIGAALIAQRVTPLERIWLFALPALIVVACGGLSSLLLLLPDEKLRDSGAILVALILVLVMGLATLRGDIRMKGNPAGPVADAESLAQQIASFLQPGDAVLSISPVTAPLKFYMLAHDIPVNYLYDRSTPFEFERGLAVVANNSSLDEVVSRLGISGQLQLQSAQVLDTTPFTTIYRLEIVP